MLKDVGCRYVIVGHSERRRLYHEDDTLVARKFGAVLNVGLTPVLCLGETLEEREAERTEAVVARQLDAVTAMNGVPSLCARADRVRAGLGDRHGSHGIGRAGAGGACVRAPSDTPARC